MRRPFTVREAHERGITHSMLKTGVKTRRFHRLSQGVYLDGPAPPTALERALGTVIGTGGVASGTLAGILHGLDGMALKPPFATINADTRRPHVRQRHLDDRHVIDANGYQCTSGLQTMLDIAATLDDVRWEQALESALRKRLTTIDEIREALTRRHVGNGRIRRVLALRPPEAPATGSLLETLMVQLIRTDPSLPVPERQVQVRSTHDTFIAYVDLAWPEHGLFLELDGQQHKDQPVYDARRETAVVATKGWLPGRFTWHEVTRVPKPTLRRVRELFDRAASQRITIH